MLPRVSVVELEPQSIAIGVIAADGTQQLVPPIASTRRYVAGDRLVLITRSAKRGTTCYTSA